MNLSRAARARAKLHGRDYCVADDIRAGIGPRFLAQDPLAKGPFIKIHFEQNHGRMVYPPGGRHKGMVFERRRCHAS